MLSRIFFLLACFPPLILIHELGHFAIARLLKIRLAEFVVGFGASLFQWHGKEITYRFHLVPFAAYVKPVSDRSDDPHLLRNQHPWRQTLFFAGGAIANLALAILLLWAHLGSLPSAIAQLLNFFGLFSRQMLSLFVGSASASSFVNSSEIEQIAFLSLAFGCINLVPIMPFDGAHILILWGRRFYPR